MSKFTDEELRRIISLRLSDKYESLFVKHRKNAYKIKEIWVELARELGQPEKSDAIKTKFNDLLKQFRKKKLDASKSGASPSSWKFYSDFVESSSKGTEIVSSSAYDSGISDGKGSLEKSTHSTTEINEAKRKKVINASDKFSLCLESIDKKTKLLKN